MSFALLIPYPYERRAAGESRGQDGNKMSELDERRYGHMVTHSLLFLINLVSDTVLSYQPFTPPKYKLK